MRPSIADIMAESGASRATVDRVLNNRAGVHPRTRAVVERAVARLLNLDDRPKARSPIDFLIRVDQGMMSLLAKSFACLGERPHHVFDVGQQSDAAVLAKVQELCRDTERPLVVTVKNTPRVVAELAHARRRGKTVITLISDLPPEARDAFVGIDNRKAGETAAFLIGQVLGDRPAIVGLVFGDHSYSCHEDREIGFRTALRSRFPRIAVAAEAIGQDSPMVTRAAVRALLEQHPGIAALYNVSGGNAGLAEAVVEVGRDREILVISHEINEVNVAILEDGTIDFLISQNPLDLLNECVRQIDRDSSHREKGPSLVDFGIYCRHNVPRYGFPGEQT